MTSSTHFFRSVIHFILLQAVTTELPAVLSGKPPAKPSSSLGTGNWSAPPRALLLGGAYQNEDIEKLQKLVNETEGAVKIPWLRVDSSKGPPPSQAPTEAQAREYGAKVSNRMKERLHALEAEGKLVEGNGEVYLV